MEDIEKDSAETIRLANKAIRKKLSSTFEDSQTSGDARASGGVR